MDESFRLLSMPQIVHGNPYDRVPSGPLVAGTSHVRYIRTEMGDTRYLRRRGHLSRASNGEVLANRSQAKKTKIKYRRGYSRARDDIGSNGHGR